MTERPILSCVSPAVGSTVKADIRGNYGERPLPALIDHVCFRPIPAVRPSPQKLQRSPTLQPFVAGTTIGGVLVSTIGEGGQSQTD